MGRISNLQTLVNTDSGKGVNGGYRVIGLTNPESAGVIIYIFFLITGRTTLY